MWSFENPLRKYLSGYRGPERRHSPRRRVISTAWVRLVDSPLPLVAVLWDVSENGARLAVANPDELPDEFAILFSRDDTRSQACRVIWRAGQQVGVQFSTPLDINTIASLENQASIK